MKALALQGILLVCLFSALHAVEFMDVSEVRPGMTGYGLSVFHGWEPVRFDAEIIDIMHNTSPKGDIILARLSGQNLEKSGVIAGMSGSPVYIAGKLIGAVAYTWSYTKEPLCGITPIRQMLREKENAENNLPGTGSPDSGTFQKISMPLSFSGFTGEARDFMKKAFQETSISETGGLSALDGAGGGSASSNSSVIHMPSSINSGLSK